MGRYILILLLSIILSPATAQYRNFERGSIIFFNYESIHAYFFTSKDMALHVMDEGCATTPNYGSLEKAMQRSTCVAGINASYFAADEQHNPIGLVIAQEEKISPFSQGRFTVAGILYDTGTQIVLERSSQLSFPVNKMKAAIQAGPFLVENGKAVAGLDQKKIAARSFIATDGQGNWCIAMASARSLGQLAQELERDNILGDFNVQSALNLDGGSSCAFWAWKHIFVPSYKQVRTYAGIKPRGK